MSATPYNKDYDDIRSQLALFLRDDEDLGLMPHHYLQSMAEQQKRLKSSQRITFVLS